MMETPARAADDDTWYHHDYSNLPSQQPSMPRPQRYIVHPTAYKQAVLLEVHGQSASSLYTSAPAHRNTPCTHITPLHSP